MSDLFLTKEEVAQLTGWQRKQKQIGQLRKMGILFWINAQDVPVVPRSAIDGRPEEPAKRVKVVPLMFRTDLPAAELVELGRRVQPGIRKK